MRRFLLRSAAFGALFSMCGCASSLSGKLSTVESGLETLSVAPLMACSVVVQQSQMILNKLATGTVIAPAIAGPPTMTAAPPVTAPIMAAPVSSGSGQTIVTPTP